MTLQEAIGWIDEKQPNVCSRSDKLRWLSELDGSLWEMMHSAGMAPEPFSGYTGETLPGQVLLAPFPYDAIYRYWLEAQIDYSCADYARFNNAMAMYGKYYGALVNHCLRGGVHRETEIRYY